MPVRPVVPVNVRPSERDMQVPLATDQGTARVMDLFNVAYEILLQILERFFAHTEETDAQLKTLADATVDLMFRVIKPLGDLITTLPAGLPGLDGRAELRAVLRERLPDAAPGRGLGPADRTAGDGRRVLPDGHGRPGGGQRRAGPGPRRPGDGAWPAAQIDVFRRWTESGTPG